MFAFMQCAADKSIDWCVLSIIDRMHTVATPSVRDSKTECPHRFPRSPRRVHIREDNGSCTIRASARPSGGRKAKANNDIGGISYFFEEALENLPHRNHNVVTPDVHQLDQTALSAARNFKCVSQ
jgi:hypothetical protein